MVTNKKSKTTSRELSVSDVIVAIIDLMRLSTDFQNCVRIATRRRLASFSHPKKSLAGLDKIIEDLREFACRVAESLAPFAVEDTLVDPIVPLDDGTVDVLGVHSRSKGAASRLCFKACYRKSLTSSAVEKDQRGAKRKASTKARRPRDGHRSPRR